MLKNVKSSSIINNIYHLFVIIDSKWRFSFFTREKGYQPGRIFTYIDADPFNYSDEVNEFELNY